MLRERKAVLVLMPRAPAQKTLDHWAGGIDSTRASYVDESSRISVTMSDRTSYASVDEPAISVALDSWARQDGVFRNLRRSFVSRMSFRMSSRFSSRMSARSAAGRQPSADDALAQLQASFPDIRNAKLRRFLKAANGRAEAAAAHLTKHVAWLKALPVDIKAQAAVELQKRKLYIRGRDREGRHLLVWRTSLNDPRERDPLIAQLSVIFWSLQLEEIVDAEAEESADKVEGALLVDRVNSVLDLPVLSSAVPILQENFPELLGAIYITPAGFALRAMFGLVSPLLNEETRRLLKMVGTCEELKQKHIDASALPVHMGGTPTIGSLTLTETCRCRRLNYLSSAQKITFYSTC